MTKEEIFDFLHQHLKIKVENNPTPSMFGGECEGNYGVKVTLLLLNPLTNEEEPIDWDECDLTY